MCLVNGRVLVCESDQKKLPCIRPTGIHPNFGVRKIRDTECDRCRCLHIGSGKFIHTDYVLAKPSDYRSRMKKQKAAEIADERKRNHCH